jgi:hypothetical protein
VKPEEALIAVLVALGLLSKPKELPPEVEVPAPPLPPVELPVELPPPVVKEYPPAPPLPPGAREPSVVPPPYYHAGPPNVIYWRQVGPDCYEYCLEGGHINWVGECREILISMAWSGELDRRHEECERAAGVSP